LTFGLWELAKHPEAQSKLRAEVDEAMLRVRERGDTDFTGDDFESMPYLAAVTKVRRPGLFVSPNEHEIHQVFVQEILRVHPIIIEVMREPIEDDLLPLSKPVVGTSGTVYSQLPIPKGTMVTLSAFGYNMYVNFSIRGRRPPKRGAHNVVLSQAPGCLGSGRSRVPTGTSSRNQGPSGIPRWGLWKSVRLSRMEF